MKKEPDWTQLESYASLPVDQITAKIRSCGHMMILSNVDWAEEIVGLCVTQGDAAGLSAFVSALMVQRHGPTITAKIASDMYLDIAKELNNTTLRLRIMNVIEWLSWTGTIIVDNISLPVKWPYKDVKDRAGLANVMLGVSQSEFVKCGKTTSLLTAISIQRFLEKRD